MSIPKILISWSRTGKLGKKVIAPDIFRSFAIPRFGSFYPTNQFESQFKSFFYNLAIVILKFTDHYQFTTPNRQKQLPRGVPRKRCSENMP